MNRQGMRAIVHLEQAGMPMIVDSLIKTNPFDTNVYSPSQNSYSMWRDGKLIYPNEPQRRPSPLAESAHNSFRASVLNTEFPCIGGKAALGNNTYRFGFYSKMGAPATTAGLAYDLWEYVRERPSFGTEYATFVASFATPIALDEREWEKLLWAQLQNLHELDRPLHSWDPTVSSDIEDTGFSFSFAETAFFVVGLHPTSSRHARRFVWPTLVFNAHAQFEQLREQNRFERLKETIRTRDFKLQNSLNPNLSSFGEQSEARQYSGRAVEEKWKCPFRLGLEVEKGKQD